MKRLLRTGATAASLAALFVACWPSRQSLEPYPCAKDGTCGASAWCAPDIGCIEHASEFEPCRDSNDCQDGASCFSGVCAFTADSFGGGKCATGTVGAPSGNPFSVPCFADCGAGETCGPGSTCTSIVTCSDYHCSSEGTGRACIGKLDAPLLNKSCQGGQCGDSIYWCHNQTCVLTCSAGFSCPAGLVCVSDGGSANDAAKAGCFADCTSGQACPTGLACTLVGSGKKACLPSGSSGTTAACVSVSDTQTCGTNFKCGVSGQACGSGCTQGMDNTLPDGTCPVNTNTTEYGCGTTNPQSCHCQCNAGYTGVDCQTGTSCNSNDCTGKTWGCRPTNPPGCNDDTDGFSGTCNCANGKTTPFSCGGTQTCEQLCEALM